jgi:hypothetical protein
VRPASLAGAGIFVVVSHPLWCLSIFSAAIAGAVAAVWAVSYWAEEDLSVRRVLGTAEQPEETSLIVLWSRGRVTLLHRVRAGDDPYFAPFARQFLGRGWFFYRTVRGAPICVDDQPTSSFAAGRSHNPPDGPIELQSRWLTFPCWFLVALFAALPIAVWAVGRAAPQALGTASSTGFVLALVPLAIAGAYGRRKMQDAVHRIRQIRINKALAEGRLEQGMTMEQVQHVLAGWTGRRTHYSLGRRKNKIELWLFSPDAPQAGRMSADEFMLATFLNGELAASGRHHCSAG